MRSGCEGKRTDVETVIGILGTTSAAVVLATGAYVGAPWSIRRKEEQSLRQKAVNQRTLVLTYDDGPGPSLTTRVLEVLAGSKVAATFFLLGMRAAAAPQTVDRLVAGGHEIGCHTQRHLHAWKVAPWSSVRDIDEGYRTLSKWMPDAAIFRPPYGKMTLLTRHAVRRRGATIGWWTIDSGDTHARLPSPGQAAEQVAREGGGVVLMHDFDRLEDGPNRAKFVITVTESLLRTAAREGIQVRLLSDLMGGNGRHG
jgi:peptidoglycan/xylan/chitin deacetylase (PgdA/CDA1 family)